MKTKLTLLIYILTLILCAPLYGGQRSVGQKSASGSITISIIIPELPPRVEGKPVISSIAPKETAPKSHNPPTPPATYTKIKVLSKDETPITTLTVFDSQPPEVEAIMQRLTQELFPGEYTLVWENHDANGSYTLYVPLTIPK